MTSNCFARGRALSKHMPRICVCYYSLLIRYLLFAGMTRQSSRSNTSRASGLRAQTGIERANTLGRRILRICVPSGKRSLSLEGRGEESGKAGIMMFTPTRGPGGTVGAGGRCQAGLSLFFLTLSRHCALRGTQGWVVTEEGHTSCRRAKAVSLPVNLGGPW